MSAYHDFDAEAPELPKEGPVFKLGGEEFHCIPAAPGGAMLRLINAIGKDARGRQTYNLPDIDAFVREVLIEEREVVGTPATETTDDNGNVVASPDLMVTEPADDIERWEALLNDKKRPMDISQLGSLLMWLQEEYTTRPTQRSER